MERNEQQKARRIRGNRLKKMRKPSTAKLEETDVALSSTNGGIKPGTDGKKGSIADRTGSWLREKKESSLFFLGEAKQELTNGKK